MLADLLLLADSRLPAGAHAHSGGIEAAVARGLVRDLPGLEAFLAGRLATAGRQAAAVAATACHGAGSAAAGFWDRLDAEVSARVPSPAQREASRAQGRALLRVVARVWPTPALAGLGERPHHPVVLGVAVAAGGGTPRDAAAVAASAAVTGPASAALRLLGLDPVEVTRLTAAFSPDIDRIAAEPVRTDPSELPAPGAPALDLLAQLHAEQEVRLFAS